jgi:hypothetical protein
MNQCINQSFKIPTQSKSGSEWESYSFDEFSNRYRQENKSYGLNPILFLRSLFREIVREVGILKGSVLILRTLVWDWLFNKPRWRPEEFDIVSTEQETFYKEKFNEFLPLIIFYRSLGRMVGNERADRLLADSTLPLVLNMMNSIYSPIEKLESIDLFLQQTRNYLGSEWEEGKGFSGDVYIANDKSELWFHVTRCAPMQILRGYGLHFLATAYCMCDHITYHTLFPNMIFRRCHNLASGDPYCDLEFRIRKKSDPIMDEDYYADCGRDPEMRAFVWDWEEKAKVMFFGSVEKWQVYANQFFPHSIRLDSE